MKSIGANSILSKQKFGTQREVAMSMHRALTGEFLTYLEKRGGNPKITVIKKWFRDKRGGSQSNAISDMLNGRYVPERFAAGFIEMLILDSGTREMRQPRTAMIDFLKLRGFCSVEIDSLDAILSFVATPIIHVSVRRKKTIGKTVDYLSQGVRALPRLAFDYLVEHSVRGCGSNDTGADLATAIGWNFVRVGEMISSDAHISYDAATKFAETRMNISRCDYLERALSWHHFNPWTTIISHRRLRAVGMSTVLPVTEHFYENVKSGRCASYDCTPNDMTVPAQHIIIECCAENPDVLRSRATNPTRSMLAALTIQITALSRYGKESIHDRYHWMSFGGTPTNTRRLLDAGFQLVNMKMASTGVELMERVLDLKNPASTVPFEHAILLIGGSLCPSAPPMK